MDHLCPWVGGVVAEASFKYFLQFTFYAAILCTEILIVMAYFFAQRRKHTDFLNTHWVVMIALSGLFLLFSAGMFMSSCQFALLNVTTIENLSRKTKVWYLAVYASPQVVEEVHKKRIELKLISYPRPPEEELRAAQNGDVDRQSPVRPSSAPAQLPVNHRIFAILESRPGQNPFHLGNLANFQDLMGTTIWEWLNPFSPSPTAKHDDPTSLYKLGPAVDEMKASTGLDAWTSEKRRRRRRRKSSTSEGL